MKNQWCLMMVVTSAVAAAACSPGVSVPEEDFPVSSVVAAGGKADSAGAPVFQCSVDRKVDQDDFFRVDDLHCERSSLDIFEAVFAEVWSGDDHVTSGDLSEATFTTSFYADRYPIEIRYQAVADRNIVGDSFNLRGRFVIEDDSAWSSPRGPALPFSLWTLEIRAGDDKVLFTTEAYEVAAGEGYYFGNDRTSTTHIDGIFRGIEPHQTLVLTLVAPASGSLEASFYHLNSGEAIEVILEGDSVHDLGGGGVSGEPGVDDPAADVPDGAAEEECGGGCAASEVCVQGGCIERSAQVQEMRDSFRCRDAEAVCESDAHCAEGHTCLEGLCHRNQCL